MRFSTTATDGAPDWLIVWRSAGNDIYLMGFALDYCVKYSTPDARHLRFNTHVIIDGCCGIELEPSDMGRALNEMKRAGATLLESSDL